MSNITLRDHFAGLAMQSYVNRVDVETAARYAYHQADAMITERNKHLKERHEELCQGAPV